MTPEQGLRESEKEAEKAEWRPYPGGQTLALTTPAREILYGGARGPGKTTVQQHWFAKHALAADSSGRYLYPGLRCLLLRYRATDLKDWNDRAFHLYVNRMQAKPVGNPPEYRFPWGPVIRTGHLQEAGFQKYVGWEVHKAGIDEITHIPRKDDYELFVGGTLRMSPDGNSQMFATGNPGFPGDRWVKERWVNVYAGGEKIKPRTMFRDPVSGLTRIFINGTVFDNPLLMQRDPAFLQGLMALPEAKRKAWIYGDWEALSGQFFAEWRPVGPIDASEPPWARHVIEPEEIHIPAFCHRWLSMDWGFAHPAVVHAFANAPDRRVHVYDELFFGERVSSFEIGVQIGKRFFKDLEGLPDHQMTMYLSPDAFNTVDEGSRRVNSIAAGIQAVLGAGSAVVLEMNEDERRLRDKDPEAAFAALNRRRAEVSGEYCITIVRANNDRIDGWNYCHEMLRWRPAMSAGKPDMNVIRSLRTEPHGEDLVRRYLKAFDQAPEVLPRVLVHSRCARLKETIPGMVYDPHRPEDMLKVDGDDPVDSWRYGMIAHRDMQNQMPFSHYVFDRMNDAAVKLYGAGIGSQGAVMDYSVLHRIRLKAEEDYERQFQAEPGIRLGRAGEFRGRVQ